MNEVKETKGFTMKIEDVREADFRLANRRLRPLGHLTANAKCKGNQHFADRDFTLTEAMVFLTAALIKIHRKWADFRRVSSRSLGTLVERHRQNGALLMARVVRRSLHIFFRLRPPAGSMGRMWDMRMSQPMGGSTEVGSRK